MGELTITSVVPILNRHNAIFIQAKLLSEAIGNAIECRRRTVSSEDGCFAGFGNLVLYHFGSYDRHAQRLSRQRRTVFVYHNVTPPSCLWKWSPLVAIRAILGRAQLRSFPRDLPWLALSPYSQQELAQVGFHEIGGAPCIVPKLTSSPKCERPRLLFVGRITPSKNVIGLLRCYLLATKGLRVKPELLIVGPRKDRCMYADAFERELYEIQRRFPVVWHREALSYSALKRLYGSSWLYVSASLHEGFGVPVLEAVSSGTPALYMRCGGTESVLDGIGSLPQGSTAAFASAIQYYLENPIERDRLLQQQASYLCQCHSDNVARRVLEFLEKLFPLELGRRRSLSAPLPLASQCLNP